jgi:pyruvate/2-oxoglutarate dehydrogenase complex dihydrolipoamide dehydrogenase (E3) component
VYAIGEVTQKQHPCIATAMAEGVVAAKAILNCHVAE